MVALLASRLMAAVCLVPPSGHDKTLEAITECAIVKDVERFVPIVQGRELIYYVWRLSYHYVKVCLSVTIH